MDGIGPREQADRRYRRDVVFIFGKPLSLLRGSSLRYMCFHRLKKRKIVGENSLDILHELL